MTFQPQLYDVAVIGAGPAGSRAALQIARAGRTVALIEKCRLPRYKTCGGGLLGRACGLVPPSTLAQTVEFDCRSAELTFGGSTGSFVVERDDPIVRMTMRATLDAALAQEAQAAGADLITGRVHSLREADGWAEAATDQGAIRARFVIGADGATGATARCGIWPGIARAVPAVEWEVEVDRPTLERFQDRARFDFSVGPCGYGWVFPKRDHLSVGLLSMAKSPPRLNGAVAQYLERLNARPISPPARHGYMIPHRPRPGPLLRGRIGLAGDAAGLADPLTFEGIGPALLSGQCLADAILESGFVPARAADIYQASLEARLLRELRAARGWARLLYRHPKIAQWLFRRCGGILAELVADVVTGKRAYSALTRAPKNYFELVRRLAAGNRIRPPRSASTPRRL